MVSVSFIPYWHNEGARPSRGCDSVSSLMKLIGLDVFCFMSQWQMILIIDGFRGLDIGGRHSSPDCCSFSLWELFKTFSTDNFQLWLKMTPRAMTEPNPTKPILVTTWWIFTAVFSLFDLNSWGKYLAVLRTLFVCRLCLEQSRYGAMSVYRFSPINSLKLGWKL